MIRIERLEILFDEMSREETTKNQQLTESIGALGMALANLTAPSDSLPALTESTAAAGVITSQTASSTLTQPTAHKSVKMLSTPSVRGTPYSRKDGQRDYRALLAVELEELPQRTGSFTISPPIHRPVP
ncbi:hypothetical protein MRX96_050978 [Rhipicephalus microplus]